MNGAAQLRVTQPDPQALLPWADGAVNHAVAIPVEDLDLYMARKDIQRPSYFNVSYRIKIDKRYPDLLDYCRTAGIPCWQGLSILVLTVGAAIGQDFKGVLAQRGEPLQATDLCDFWLWPRGEATAIQTGVALALRARFLTTVDVNDPAVVEAYGRVRARTPANVDGRTDRPIENTSTAPSACEKKIQAAMAVQAPPDRPALPAEWKLIAAQLYRDLRDLRARLNPPMGPWPAEGNRLDHYDLELAVKSAIHHGRVEELRAVVLEAARWAETGRGFRTALQDAGFLRRAKVIG